MLFSADNTASSAVRHVHVYAGVRVQARRDTCTPVGVLVMGARPMRCVSAFYLECVGARSQRSITSVYAEWARR